MTGRGAFQSHINLDLFHKVNIGGPCILMGKIVKMSFEETKIEGNVQMDKRFMILKETGPQGLVCPHPGQYTCILP